MMVFFFGQHLRTGLVCLRIAADKPTRVISTDDVVMNLCWRGPKHCQGRIKVAPLFFLETATISSTQSTCYFEMEGGKLYTFELSALQGGQLKMPWLLTSGADEGKKQVVGVVQLMVVTAVGLIL